MGLTEAVNAPLRRNERRYGMVARQTYDRGVSVLKASQFNYGNASIPVITEDMAREVMDFTIEKRPCMTEDGIAIPRMNYLRRSDGGIVDALCSVGEEFEVTSQPKEILEFASGIVSVIPGLRYETVATMYNGGTSFIVLSFGDGYSIRGDESCHYQNIVMVNPCTRGRLHFVSSHVRVVCQNTLQMAMKGGNGYRITHTKNGRIMVENALESIRTRLNDGIALREKFNLLASRNITTQSIGRILDRVYPLPALGEDGKPGRSFTLTQNKRDEVISQFEGDTSFTEKTYWSFLNAMTYLQEHPTHKQERVDSVQVAFENIVGPRADRKGEFLEAVYEEARMAA